MHGPERLPHTVTHRGLPEMASFNVFNLLPLIFFATVNILEQLSIISSSVTGCPKGQ